MGEVFLQLAGGFWAFAFVAFIVAPVLIAMFFGPTIHRAWLRAKGQPTSTKKAPRR